MSSTAADRYFDHRRREGGKGLDRAKFIRADHEGTLPMLPPGGRLHPDTAMADSTLLRARPHEPNLCPTVARVNGAGKTTRTVRGRRPWPMPGSGEARRWEKTPPRTRRRSFWTPQPEVTSARTGHADQGRAAWRAMPGRTGTVSGRGSVPWWSSSDREIPTVRSPGQGRRVLTRASGSRQRRQRGGVAGNSGCAAPLGAGLGARKTSED